LTKSPQRIAEGVSRRFAEFQSAQFTEIHDSFAFLRFVCRFFMLPVPAGDDRGRGDFRETLE
ncbi:MAG: hypothetical protein O2955_18965, partial [Planctomycetota bacterium]|nr:hypothetical protein [Planctomycetota bacterium]